MNSYNKFERGSEWRKWDLQVGTKYYTNYRGISLSPEQTNKLIELTGLSSTQINSDHKNLTDEEYAKIFVEYILNFTDVAVVAITNHNTGKGIQEILNYLNSKKDSNSNNVYNELTIFPGVEIGGCDRCHILIIFNPETNNKNKFIFDLNGHEIHEKSWNEYIEEFLNDINIPNPRFNNGAPANSRDLGAFDIITFSEKWDFIPIFPHINNPDGLFHELQESNRKELYKNKNFGIVDSKSVGNNNNLQRVLDGDHIDWGDKVIAQIVTSDARSLSEIGKSFSWIKADPTFIGLKQIIFEPKLRVINQENLPEDKTGYQVIDKIEILNEFIHNTVLYFNSNLNSIIGGKSTGKSVLLCSIAKKLKTERSIIMPDEDYDNFIQSISDSIKVFWKDGKEDNNREIEYFQQGYMHDLATSSDKLDNLVQDILRQKGKETILNSYNKIQSGTKKIISSYLNDLFQILKDIKEKEQKVREKGDKKGIDDEISKLINELKKLNVTEINDAQKDSFEKSNEVISEAKQNIFINEIDIKNIELLKEFGLFTENLEYELTSISEDRRKQVEIIFDNLNKEYSKKWKLELDVVIKNTKEKIEKENKTIKLTTEDENYKMVVEAFAQNAQLKEYSSKIQLQKEKLFEINTLLDEIMFLKKQRFNIIELVKEEHQKFFKELNNLVPNLSDSKDGLAIKAKVKFNQKRFSEILYSGLNLQGQLNQDIADFKYSDDNEQYEKHIFDLFIKLVNGKLTLKGGYTSQSFSNTILSECFYYHSYDIEYEGDDFKRMSDGKKAFVVLKLLLDFSDKDCPILIDQPEDDLDNRSIYLDLVQYLRKKKRLRQIIVATHNPNIVVGADSELIVCANQDGLKNLNRDRKKFQYISGSLEHSFAKNNTIDEVLESKGTREHVCEILEGGDIAFKLREKKYSIE